MRRKKKLKNKLTKPLTTKSTDGLLATELDFSSFIVRTAKNTLRRAATLKNLELGLTEYIYTQKTGAYTMSDVKRRNFPWKIVLTETNQSLDGRIEKSKILDYLEKKLDEWLASQGSAIVELDPAFVKAAKKHLHKILKGAHNQMNIDALAMAYLYESDQGFDMLETTRSQIRAYIATDDAFSITKGGMATVIRVLDEHGKKTGLTAPVQSAGGEKLVKRYGSNIAKLVTQAQFEALKSKHKDGIPMAAITALSQANN